MKASLPSLLISFLGFSAACSNLAPSVDPSSGGMSGSAGRSSHAGSSAISGEAGEAEAGSTDPGEGGSSSEGGNGSLGGRSSLGGGTSHAGSGNAHAGGSSNNGGEAGTGTTGGGTLALTSAEAHVVGRDGDAVRFTVQGTRPESGVYSLALSFEDADGQALALFDGDWDGSLEASDGRIVFDAPINDETFTATATLRGLKDATKLSKAKVALVDGTDHESDPVEATVVQQDLLSLGQACDPELIKNRCDVGQACSGTPSKCSAGVAPNIVELKYLHATGGPLILMRGSDPDDDMGLFHIELLNASNMPANLDPDPSSFDTKSANLSERGTFFGFLKGGVPLETAAPKVRVTPIDALGHQGSAVSANIANVTRAADAQTCDPRGFSGCAVTSVCVAGAVATSGKCTSIASARAAECAAAIKLDPAAGLSYAAGRMSGVSIWDPPVGCVTEEKLGRPEGVVSLHLAHADKTLTVSTHRPETDIDTVVYLIPGCGDSADISACNDDDVAGYASEFTLKNVAAGNYTIIVESGQLAGGSFGLVVTAN